jgi:HSP20 family molecular chaperone IbpA
VAKEDIHISFQRNRLILTWGTGEIHEWEEDDGVIYREHVRKMYHRTLPLPEGTRVRNTILVLCTMDCIDLIFFSSKRYVPK